MSDMVSGLGRAHQQTCGHDTQWSLTQKPLLPPSPLPLMQDLAPVLSFPFTFWNRLSEPPLSRQGQGRGAASSFRQLPGSGVLNRSSEPLYFSGHPRDYLCCPRPGLTRDPLVKAGHLPTRSSFLWEGTLASRLQEHRCSLGSCTQNKCRGKSEEKCFYPFIIISKSRCLTRRLLLTWGGDQPLCPTVSVLTAGAGRGGPVSSCPSSVLGLKRSQVSLFLQPFFCITPAKP